MSKGKENEAECNVDGVRFINIWITMGLIDYILTHKLHLKTSICGRQLKGLVGKLPRYDLLSVHGYEAGVLADQVQKKPRSLCNYLAWF